MTNGQANSKLPRFIQLQIEVDLTQKLMRNNKEKRKKRRKNSEEKGKTKWRKKKAVKASFVCIDFPGQ